MAWTQSDVDKLDALYAKGLRRGRIGGEEVEFRDVAEYERLRRMMQAEIAGTSSRAMSVTYPTTGRGL